MTAQGSQRTNAWPRTPAGRLAWLENRLAEWTAHAEALGIGPAELATLTEATLEAREALTEAITLRSRAKSATLRFKNAADPMTAIGGALLQGIRARAAATSQPELFALARIEPIAPHSAAAPPMTPTNIRSALTSSGSIALTWKSINPRNTSGTSFVIYRRLDMGKSTSAARRGAGASSNAESTHSPPSPPSIPSPSSPPSTLSSPSGFRQIGCIGIKRFTDHGVPPGTHAVQYIIRAVRGGKTSEFSFPHTMYLGAMKMDNGESIHIAA